MKNLLMIAIAILLLSCNSTEITSSWAADNVKKKDFKKVMVLGIINDKDRAFREQLENQLVIQLEDLGYEAHSSLKTFGPKAFDNLDEDEIVNRLTSSKYDAVITTVLLDVSKEETYRPGHIRYQPVGVAYNRFGRYYTTIYNRIYEPGYYSTSTDYFLESNLYELKTGTLQYSVQSKTFDPSGITALTKDYSKQIVKDLRRQQVLAKL